MNEANPDPSAQLDDPSWLTLTTSRSEIIHQIQKRKLCDVLVVGGGITGTAFARLAAFNGLRTVLFERGDYASGTSGRTSKMAHGGLRYLEMMDFKQVTEGVRARELLYNSAPHLVRPHDFLIPLTKGDVSTKIKFGLGLSLYDRMARTPRALRHAWIKANAVAGTPLEAQRQKLAGCFRFSDGIMDDARLVLEQSLSARQEGALCLNYAEVRTFEVRLEGAVQVAWTDLLSGIEHQLSAGIIVNCAGPWAPTLGRLTPAPQFPAVRYSRGIHLLFNRPWQGPALLFPLGRGKNYFVWPNGAGTLVGTTDHATERVEWDPIPTLSETDELLDRLARDIPEAGLTRHNLYYGYAGIRTLPVRGSRTAPTASISRRHEWIHTPGMLTLLGGKYTSAAPTVEEGLKKLVELSSSPLASNTAFVSLGNRKLPGAADLERTTAEFRSVAQQAHADPLLVERAILKLGSRVRHFSHFADPFRAIGGCVLKGEIELVLATEQVETLEDLMRRRLGIELYYGSGLGALDEIAAIMNAHKPGFDVIAETARYRERIAKIQAALGISAFS